MMGCREALKYLVTVGVDNIEARTGRLIGQLKNELDKIDKVRLLDRGAQQCNYYRNKVTIAAEISVVTIPSYFAKYFLLFLFCNCQNLD